MVPQARPEIQSMPEDEQGEEPGPGERFLKLNAGEAPFAPSPRVVSAIRDLEPERLRAYPPAWAEPFREAAAAHHGLAPGNILAGNASEALLECAIRTFVAAGGRVASPWPTWPRIEALCQGHGAVHARADWLEGWALPGAQLLALRPNLVYLANPNVPSGTAVAVEAVADLAGRFKGIVLVDEAYADFADANCVSLLAEHQNLVIVRTLSAGYALAGLRFAYAMAHPEVIAQMAKLTPRCATSAVQQEAAIAALADQDHAQRLWEHVRGERGRLMLELGLMSFEVPPSQANFVLARHPTLAAEALCEGLRKQGVLVREEAGPGGLRITVGTSQENNALLGALEPLVGKAPPREGGAAPG